MSAATIGIYAAQNASETRPTTSGRGVFEFKRAVGSVAHSITLAYTLRSSSTTTTADYAPLSGIVTIPAGQRTVAINVNPVDDALVEGTEKLDITLKSRSDSTNVHSWAEVTIADNDLPTVGVYASNGHASETDPTGAGKGQFIFRRLAGPTTSAVNVSYVVDSASTATSGSDYQTLSGTVTIPVGATSAAVDLIPIDDSAQESAETVQVSIVTSSLYTIGHTTAALTIDDNDGTTTSGWLGDTRSSRASLTFNPGSTARTNQPFDYGINFSSVLTNLSKGGSLLDNSIKVVEVSSSGTLVNASVPFQFDHAATGYNAATNASGDLVVQATGTSAANTTRYYQVYFDTTGSYTAPTFSSLNTTTDNVNDSNGINSIKVQTPTGTYYYQKPYGAFSSIIDTEGHDWVSWNSTPGSAGEYRGTENLGPIGFHPGRSPTLDDNSTADTLTTTIVSSGPLKTVIDSKAAATGNETRWEIYPTFARLTVLSVDNNRPYWFLYEATPGGGAGGGNTINSADHVYTSTGSQLNALNTNHDASNTNFNNSGEEWAYIQNTAVNSGNGRYIFLVHNNTDSATDSYYDLDNNMTVFGFGRNNVPNDSIPVLTGQNTFTIGLANGGSDFASASAYIKGQYKDVTLATGSNAKL